jgi:class 3 adenylate cyclase
MRDGGRPAISFRIGINIGDVIIEGEAIFGDGVNVAARVESECEPGGVCGSGSAFEQERGKAAFAFDDLGDGLSRTSTGRCAFMRHARRHQRQSKAPNCRPKLQRLSPCPTGRRSPHSWLPLVAAR